MRKLKLIAVMSGIVLIVVNSAFTTKMPPWLKQYGWEQGVTGITYNNQESITGGSFVDFTQYHDLVRLESVVETCPANTGTFCKPWFPATEETDNVRFTLDADEIHITIRIREPLTSSPSYVSIPSPSSDNTILSY